MKILRFFKRELTDQVKLIKQIKNSPLSKWGRSFKRNMELTYAIASAEWKKMWTGKEYMVFLSDEHTKFYVLSERELAGVLRYAKRKKFMRRPEMRKRLVYRTDV